MVDHQYAFKQFTDYLRSEGKSITPERLDILDLVLHEKGHFRIEDVIRKNERVSRATVYRTLKTIEDAGLIKYIRTIHDEKIFEVVKEHHDHMICEVCGKIIEFHDPELESLQNDICASRGFSPTRHTMKIFGICPACQKRRSQENTPA